MYGTLSPPYRMRLKSPVGIEVKVLHGAPTVEEALASALIGLAPVIPGLDERAMMQIARGLDSVAE